MKLKEVIDWSKAMIAINDKQLPCKTLLDAWEYIVNSVAWTHPHIVDTGNTKTPKLTKKVIEQAYGIFNGTYWSLRYDRHDELYVLPDTAISTK